MHGGLSDVCRLRRGGYKKTPPRGEQQPRKGLEGHRSRVVEIKFGRRWGICVIPRICNTAGDLLSDCPQQGNGTTTGKKRKKGFQEQRAAAKKEGSQRENALPHGLLLNQHI